MNPYHVGLLVFGITLASVILGMTVRSKLPEHHLDADSRDSIKLAIGFVATMTALILGLFTASAKRSFDEMDDAVRNMSMQVVTLDRTLARYGTETGGIRQELAQVVTIRFGTIWPEAFGKSEAVDPAQVRLRVEKLAGQFHTLTPHNDAQRELQSRSIKLAEDLLETRWIVSVVGKSMSIPFFSFILCWLAITFTCFGLLAPRNRTVFAVMVLCSMSVGSAVFVILELDGPLEGIIKVSPEPLRWALSQLNH